MDYHTYPRTRLAEQPAAWVNLDIIHDDYETEIPASLDLISQTLVDLPMEKNQPLSSESDDAIMVAQKRVNASNRYEYSLDFTSTANHQEIAAAILGKLASTPEHTPIPIRLTIDIEIGRSIHIMLFAAGRRIDLTMKTAGRTFTALVDKSIVTEDSDKELIILVCDNIYSMLDTIRLK